MVSVKHLLQASYTIAILAAASLLTSPNPTIAQPSFRPAPQGGGGGAMPGMPLGSNQSPQFINLLGPYPNINGAPYSNYGGFQNGSFINGFMGGLMKEMMMGGMMGGSGSIGSTLAPGVSGYLGGGLAGRASSYLGGGGLIGGLGNGSLMGSVAGGGMMGGGLSFQPSFAGGFASGGMMSGYAGMMGGMMGGGMMGGGLSFQPGFAGGFAGSGMMGGGFAGMPSGF